MGIKTVFETVFGTVRDQAAAHQAQPSRDPSISIDDEEWEKIRERVFSGKQTTTTQQQPKRRKNNNIKKKKKKMLLLWCRMMVGLSVWLVGGTDVKFTPGPGLKKNADGSFSRVMDKEYMESVGGGDSEPEAYASSSAVWNVLLTLALVGGMFLYANREVVSAWVTANAGDVNFRRKPELTEEDIAEARAARLARFTGDGPKKAQEAFQEALDSNISLPSEGKKTPTTTGGGGFATLGSLKTATAADDQPDEFFGGDSTNTHK